MRVNVKLFASQAQAAGCRSVSLELPGESATCSSLRSALEKNYPALSPSLPTCRFAVNHDFATDQTLVRGSDEVALIGPVSGG